MPATDRRLSFDADVDNYRLARPAYPERVYELLTERFGLGPGTRVLEIGPGSGQATRVLLDRGAEITAVELGEHFAAQLRTELAERRLRVVVGDFATVDFDADAYDLGVCATAFRWLDAEKAVRKFARSIRAGGGLAIWCTVFGDPATRTPFRADLERLYRERMPHEQRDASELPAAMRRDERIAELATGGWFEDVQAETIRWTHRLTGSGARRLFASFPNMRELAGATRDSFLDAIAALVATHAEPDGAVADPYVTAVYTARRNTKPSPSDGE